MKQSSSLSSTTKTNNNQHQHHTGNHHSHHRTLILAVITAISSIVVATTLITNLLKADQLLKERISQISFQEDALVIATTNNDWIHLQQQQQQQQQSSSSLSSSRTTTKTNVTRTKKSTTRRRRKSSSNIKHKVQFFTLDSESIKRHNYYSGMWWTGRRNFMKMNVSKIKVLEGATYKLRPAKNFVMTLDWFDLCVEHVSRLVKHISIGFNDTETGTDNTTAENDSGSKDYDVLKHMLTGYIDKVTNQFNTAKDSATNETIAFIPMFESEEPLQVENPIGKKQRKSVLVMYSLAATLASLYQIGIGRVVIIGRTHDQPPLISTAFSIMNDLQQQQHPPTTMQLSYAWGLDENLLQQKHILLPKYAIEKMQSAMRGDLSAPETKVLLGETPSRWKYVYFTEGDLILHTRSSTLPYFRTQLDTGRSVAAFRFQLMPHVLDFPDHQYKHRLIPNVPPFSNFVDLDPHGGGGGSDNTTTGSTVVGTGSIVVGDACCDNGSSWPGLDEHGTCSGAFWVDCGLKFKRQYKLSNVSEAIYANRRLLPYSPMIRLKKTGLGAPLIQNHGRTCQPAKIGTCTQPVDG